MARNTYFSQGSTAEQHLYEDMIIEALAIYGQEVYYIPRTVVSEDDLLNEDIESKFDDAYLIEMYVENVDSFEGEGSILSKFGVQLRDSATLIAAKRTWEKVTFGTGLTRPNEGDLIYFAITKTLMEITFVEHEQPFYQLNNLPVYKMTIEAFEYGHEAIDTGIEEIDKIELDNAARAVFTLTGVSGTFQVGEAVSAADLTTGEIAAWDSSTSKLSVVGLSSNFTVDDILTGGTSAATGTISSIDTLNAADDSDPYADNDVFEDLNDNYIDFSEINPFGEVN